MLKSNMKKRRKNNSRETTIHSYRYSCGFRTTRLCARGEEEFSTSGVFDI